MADTGLILLSILTLNIWGLPDVGFHVWAPLRDERVQAICETLKEAAKNEQGWDVVLLQEVWMQKNRQTLKECGYPFVADKEDNRLPIDSGLIILSRFPIAQTERLIYPALESNNPWSDGESLARKSALIVNIQHPHAGSFWVTNTHLVAKYNEEDNYELTRLKQFKAMVDWSKAFSKDSPLILGGDWNFSPEDKPWGTVLAKIQGFTQSSNAEKACTICPPNIFHEKNEGKVDHLFASPNWTAVEGNVAFDKTFSMEGFSLNVSDHFGWETKFSLPIK